MFTSGATEADNLAVLGTARALAPQRRHIISARTEHKAVLDAVRQLAREGFSITWLPPDTDGRVSAHSVAGALRPDTALVSLMHVNNETGVIQDIEAIGMVVPGNARWHSTSMRCKASGASHWICRACRWIYCPCRPTRSTDRRESAPCSCGRAARRH